MSGRCLRWILVLGAMTLASSAWAATLVRLPEEASTASWSPILSEHDLSVSRSAQAEVQVRREGEEWVVFLLRDGAAQQAARVAPPSTDDDRARLARLITVLLHDITLDAGPRLTPGPWPVPPTAEVVAAAPPPEPRPVSPAPRPPARPAAPSPREPDPVHVAAPEPATEPPEEAAPTLEETAPTLEEEPESASEPVGSGRASESAVEPAPDEELGDDAVAAVLDPPTTPPTVSIPRRRGLGVATQLGVAASIRPGTRTTASVHLAVGITPHPAVDIELRADVHAPRPIASVSDTTYQEASFGPDLRWTPADRGPGLLLGIAAVRRAFRADAGSALAAWIPTASLGVDHRLRVHRSMAIVPFVRAEIDLGWFEITVGGEDAGTMFPIQIHAGVDLRGTIVPTSARRSGRGHGQIADRKHALRGGARR